MTLQELLAKHRIHTPTDLSRRTGLTRQYAHLLWQGKRLMSRYIAERIHQAIPRLSVARLLMAEPKPAALPRGRPRRKPRPDTH